MFTVVQRSVTKCSSPNVNITPTTAPTTSGPIRMGEAGDRTFLGGHYSSYTFAMSALTWQSCSHQLRCAPAADQIEQKTPHAGAQTLLRIRASLFKLPLTFPSESSKNANEKVFMEAHLVRRQQKASDTWAHFLSALNANDITSSRISPFYYYYYFKIWSRIYKARWGKTAFECAFKGKWMHWVWMAVICSNELGALKFNLRQLMSEKRRIGFEELRGGNK